MGFIKSIFGIIGGVFKAILSVFGIGKKSEFYMELDESAAPVETAAQPAAAQAAAPAETTAQPAAASPAAAPVAPVAPVAAAQPAASVPGFAANYLLGPTMPRRRRPGPSLSPFVDMAKQVKAR